MSSKFLFRIFPILFFVAIFILSLTPTVDFDIWFHLKSGEIISQMGLIHHDVFAFTTIGREWSPYEWLFQITIYHFNQIFGFEGIKFLVALITSLVVFIFYRILRDVFDLNKPYSIIVSFIFFTLTLGSLTPRPHLLAYTLFTFNLYLILRYYFKDINLLWLTLPATLIWANLHASIFLNIGIFLGFSFICFVEFFVLKQKERLKKFRVLSFYTLLNALLTILPPLGFMQYKFAWNFFQNREVLSQFVSEWAPLYADNTDLIIFLIILGLISSIFLASLIVKRLWRESLWVIPLLPLIVSAFLASRNIFLAILVLTLMLGFSLSKFSFSFKKPVFIFLIFIILAFHGWILAAKKIDQSSTQSFYPEKAVQFIKDYKLSGNMFNEYGYGGYLLYHLYPNQKVYIDGRTDLYLCCEMPDVLELASKKFLPDSEYKLLLDNLWGKNDISFVLLRNQKHTIIRKIAKIAQDDPLWSLVYWDDASQIFVKKDGKNESIVERFGASAATPYLKNPYREEKQQQALEEYLRMNNLADSAKSRNAIGFIYLQQKKYDQAREEFEKALKINPFLESPYMNLAELYAKDGNTEKAIELYEKAKKLASDRGLIYIRLGQLYMDTQNTHEARKVWEEGVRNTIDDDALETLKDLLSQTDQKR